MLPLASHVDYAPRALLRLKRTDERTERQTDGRQTVTLRFPVDAARVVMTQM